MSADPQLARLRSLMALQFQAFDALLARAEREISAGLATGLATGMVTTRILAAPARVEIVHPMLAPLLRPPSADNDNQPEESR